MKCPGVNAVKSLGLVDIGVMGLEFRIASISIITVYSFSWVSEAVDTLRNNNCFADLTAPSHNPPK